MGPELTYALKAYTSQFHNPEYDGEKTYVSSESFWRLITTKAEYWGAQIGVQYGEPIYATGPLPATTLPGLEG